MCAVIEGVNELGPDREVEKSPPKLGGDFAVACRWR